MGEEVNSPKADEDDDLSYLFTSDKNPTHVSDEIDIPIYSSKYEVLKEKVDVESEEKTKKPQSVVCWNCDGSHSLRDCTQPRNHAQIAQRRSENQQRYNRVVRYHKDEEQKYPHLRPGKISDRLRQAMGLRPDQAPAFVYRMRDLGYPPGWVEEARICHSGLTIIDSSGQEIKDPDLEDGEVVGEGDRDKYDFRKLIEYPGFNVPFEPGTTDETETLRATPFRESQSLLHLHRLWSGRRMGSYKRKRLKMQSSNTDSPSTSIIPPKEDMELDSDEEEVKFLPTDTCGFKPPLPDNSPPKPEPPPTEEENPPESTAGAVKRKLSEEDDDTSPEEKASKVTSSDNLTDSVTATSESKNSTDDSSTEVASPANSFHGRVKSVSSGTPVITKSEFKALPSPENFSKNICDVINFENLPNSTGKYEQMFGLIKKVRTYVVKSLANSDDEGENHEDVIELD